MWVRGLARCARGRGPLQGGREEGTQLSSPSPSSTEPNPTHTLSGHPGFAMVSLNDPCGLLLPGAPSPQVDHGLCQFVPECLVRVPEMYTRPR